MIAASRLNSRQSIESWSILASKAYPLWIFREETATLGLGASMRLLALRFQWRKPKFSYRRRLH